MHRRIESPKSPSPAHRCQQCLNNNSKIHPDSQSSIIALTQPQNPTNQPQDWEQIRNLIVDWYCVKNYSLCFIFQILVQRHRAVVDLPALQARILSWNWTRPPPPTPEFLSHLSPLERLAYRRGTFAVLRLEQPSGLLKVDIVDRADAQHIMTTTRTSSSTPAPPATMLRKTLANASSGPRAVSPVRRETGDSGYASSSGAGKTRMDVGGPKKQRKQQTARKQLKIVRPQVEEAIVTVAGGDEELSDTAEALWKLRIAEGGMA